MRVEVLRLSGRRRVAKDIWFLHLPDKVEHARPTIRADVVRVIFEQGRNTMTDIRQRHIGATNIGVRKSKSIATAPVVIHPLLRGLIEHREKLADQEIGEAIVDTTNISAWKNRR